MTKQQAQCGTWTSPITASVVAAGATPLASLVLDGPDLYWLEGRASEAGRSTLMGSSGELTPAPFNVRSKVHEYGGGAYTVAEGVAWFSNNADSRLYRIEPGMQPAPVTAEGNGQRYADFVVDAPRRRLVAVREDHSAGGHYPENTIAAIGFDGVETVLVDGNDFYAAPRISPDGRQLAWLCWDHPRMPWEGSELWLADIAEDGTLLNGRLVAGGSQESVCQPEWSPGGVLHFVSDRSGWWNLYRFAHGVVEALCPREAEFGGPLWTFGGSLYGFRSEDEIVCAYVEGGVSKLARLRNGELMDVPTPYEEIRELRVNAHTVALLGGAPTVAL